VHSEQWSCSYTLVSRFVCYEIHARMMRKCRLASHRAVSLSLFFLVLCSRQQLELVWVLFWSSKLAGSF